MRRKLSPNSENDVAISFTLQSNREISSTIQINENSSLSSAIEKSGIKPRDGTPIYALDQNDNPINSQTKISNLPRDLLLGPSKKICQVWGEKTTNRLGEANHFNIGKISVPGLAIGEYSSVFITEHKPDTKINYGYKFADSQQPYRVGDLVYVMAPKQGKSVKLFNPSSGIEDIQFDFIHENLDNIRSFWGCCQVTKIGHLGELTLRQDITPIPRNFKPLKNKSESSSKGKKKTVKITSFNITNDEFMIARGKIRFGKALICGVSSAKTGNKKGLLMCSKRKERPALINLPGFKYGMSQFIKIPETGAEVELYLESEKRYLTCQILQKQDYVLDEIRGRWVVATLKRHSKYKRALEIIGFPSDFVNN